MFKKMNSYIMYSIIIGLVSINAVLSKEQISTIELNKISSELFAMLPNYIYPNLTLNYQGHKNSSSKIDIAPDRLIKVSTQLLNEVPTIVALKKLYNNFDVNYLHQEHLTATENIEEDEFIKALLDTQILKKTMDFLALKGHISKDINTYTKTLKTIWFDFYARNNDASKRNITGSCAFEHVFMIEMQPKRRIIGMHNWIFFTTEESLHRINYMGYISRADVSNKLAVLKFDFGYGGKSKVTSMFIGTPPEFEIALYTLCFYARPNRGCKIVLGNEKFTIITYTMDSDGKQYLASVFPVFNDMNKKSFSNKTTTKHS